MRFRKNSRLPAVIFTVKLVPDRDDLEDEDYEEVLRHVEGMRLAKRILDFTKKNLSDVVRENFHVELEEE